jgi:O-antigen/teichoic acid export membrane protein
VRAPYIVVRRVGRSRRIKPRSGAQALDGKQRLVQLGRQLTKNVFSSWAAYAVRMVIAFFFVPYITSVFGGTRYGVWIIVFQAVNYFLLLDLGLSSALTRFVSKYLSRNDYPAIRRTLNSANAVYLVLGTLVIVGVYAFAELFFGYFKIPDPQLAEEGRLALLVFGVYMGFSFYLLPFGNSLGAFQRYDLVNLLTVIEEIVRAALMVVLLWHGYGLVALAMAILGTTMARHLAAVIILRRLHPEVRLSLAEIDRPTTRRLFEYSRISFGITIGWMVIFNSDSFLLGLLSSSAAAGIYNAGAQLMHHLRNLINAVGTPLVPVVSHLEAEGNMEEVRRIYLKTLRYVSYLSFLLMTGVVVFAPHFVKLWLPAEFAPTGTVMIVLAISSAVFLPQIIGNAVLFGIERHRFILYSLIVEVAMKIVLSVWLVPRYGILGMALASAIPQIVPYTTLYPYLLAKALGIPMGRILATSLKSGFVAVMVSYPTARLATYLVAPRSWIVFGLETVTVAAAALAVLYLTLETSDRQWMMRKLRGSHLNP